MDLEPIFFRLSSEYCLQILHERPSLQAAAEAQIWRWIANKLETPRTRHSIAGTWYHYAKRDEAYTSFVTRNGERVHEVLARVWADKRLRNNLLFDEVNSPGWPLLKALAHQLPDFIKQIWREAVTQERGFSFSSINGFPADLPSGPEFDDVRLEMLENIHSDDKLFDLVRVLQREGHFSFLCKLIIERLGSNRPYDRAWAMTIAGFLIPTDEAESIWQTHLSSPPVHGWLHEVYEVSHKSFAAALHMRRWCLTLGEDTTEADAWCAFRLALIETDDRYIDLVNAKPFLFKDKAGHLR